MSTPNETPKMTIAHCSRSDQSSVNATEAKKTFNGGTVWVETVMDQEGFRIHNVLFTPGARSFWHWHEKGQVLKVTAGSGWVCDKGERPKRIKTGDVVWCPPNTVHWHGADDGNYMVHEAVTIGEAKFLEPVEDKEYQAKDSN